MEQFGLVLQHAGAHVLTKEQAVGTGLDCIVVAVDVTLPQSLTRLARHEEVKCVVRIFY